MTRCLVKHKTRIFIGNCAATIFSLTERFFKPRGEVSNVAARPDDLVDP